MKKMDFKLFGVVVKGQQLGRKIGFPTANLKIQKPLPIKQGVYLTKIKLASSHETYWGMSSYWVNPINGLTFETYIFDFDREIYGENLYIEVVYFHRPITMIDGLDNLKEILSQDEKELRHKMLEIRLGN